MGEPRAGWREGRVDGQHVRVSQSPLELAEQNARALRDAGDLAGARVMLDQTLEGAKVALGEDNPDVIATAQVLAGLHREAADPAAARRVLEEAFAAGQLRLGDAHPL